MSDYIKREDTLKAMDTWDKFGCDGHGRLVPYTEEYVPYVKFDDMLKAVEGQPSVDVTPVRHGRWIEHYKSDAPPTLKERWICSWCGNVQTYGATGYCPNCGAKMDGERKGRKSQYRRVEK